MKIKPYIDKLMASSQYKQFQGKYKDAFLVAGFFVIDYETGQKMHQIDYYLPSQKKFAAFTLDEKIVMQLLKALDKRVPEKLDMNTKIDLDALQGIIQDEMRNRSITQDIKKMVAIIQTVKGKKIWNVSCVLSGMDLLKAHVEDNSKTILKMEKSSIMDYLKKMPALAPVASQMQAQAQAQGGPEEGGEDVKEETKDDIEQKIQQLDKLKEALKKEEIELDKKGKQASPEPKAEAKKDEPRKKARKSKPEADSDDK